MLQYHQFAVLLAALYGITSPISIPDDDNAPRKILTPIAISKLLLVNTCAEKF